MEKFLDLIEEYICAVCLAVMSVLTFTNVVARYVFSASFSFSEEITTHLFILLSLLGAAVAAKRKAHLGFTLISDMVSPNLRKIMHIIGYLCAVNFCGMLVFFGTQMTMSQFARNQVTAGMQWPEWVFGSFVPIGSFFILIRFTQLLYREVVTKES